MKGAMHQRGKGNKDFQEPKNWPSSGVGPGQTSKGAIGKGKRDEMTASKRKRRKTGKGTVSNEKGKGGQKVAKGGKHGGKK